MMWVWIAGYLTSAALFYAWIFRTAQPDPYPTADAVFGRTRSGTPQAVHRLPRGFAAAQQGGARRDHAGSR